jgi:membrane protein required for colicin V production
VNWFDLVLVLMLLSSAITGLRAGLARVVVGLAATVVGLLAGFWCYGLVAAKIAPWVGTPTLANLLGFACIFLAVLLIGSLVASLLSQIFRWIGLSWFNHLLGGVAGLLRGVLVITAIVGAIVAFTPSPPPQFLNESRILPYTSRLATALIDLAPRDLKDAFDEQMKSIRQFWSPKDRRHEENV